MRLQRATIIYSDQDGLIVDSGALTAGTFTQVAGLFVMFASLVAGVLAAGVIF